MRRTTAAVTIAAALGFCVCSRPKEAAPRVAAVTSITAPDTARVAVIFPVAFHVVLGPYLGYALDHTETVRTDTSLAVRVWSRDTATGAERLPTFDECDLTLTACAAVAGEFLIVAHQPDGSTLEKRITIQP